MSIKGNNKKSNKDLKNLLKDNSQLRKIIAFCIIVLILAVLRMFNIISATFQVLIILVFLIYNLYKYMQKHKNDEMTLD